MFTGNQEICLKIKEQQVEKIFELIIENESNGRLELLQLLKAIAKVSKFPLKMHAYSYMLIQLKIVG